MVKKTKLKNALVKNVAAKQKLAAQQAKEQKVQAAATAQDKRHKAKVARKVMPFESGESILLLGEGNFSFALSLVQNQPVTAALVTATAYDSEEVAYEKYPDCAANVAALRSAGATVLFSVDAGDLERTPAIKARGLDAGWAKVVWNFPHAGTGEKDQARNIALNQQLLLRFFRSVAPFLARGETRVVASGKQDKKGKKGKGKGRAVDSDDEDMNEDDLEGLAVEQDDEEKEGKKGTILITLRNAEPYTSWNVPSLLRKPPPPPPITSLPPSARPPPHTTLPPTQPRYVLVRSFAFHPSLYPGYAHRRTLGFQPGLSKAQNEEIELRGGGRTIEAELVDDSLLPAEDEDVLDASERAARREERRQQLREEKEAKGRRRSNGWKDHRNREFKPPTQAGTGWAGRSKADILASAVTSG